MFFGFKLPWCCNEDNTVQLKPSENLLQYTLQNQESKQIQRKIVKHEAGIIHQRFLEWKKVKFRSRSVRDLLKVCLAEDGKFIDPDFLHTNANISTENEMQQQFVWMRVGSLFKNPVYSSSQSLQFLEKFSFNQKTLKEALAFMQKTHMHKLKQILTKEYSQSGLYEFKLYRNGIIENIVIDDFVPTYKKRPLFTGAVRDKQVYPMIIEKALAKLCGGYDKIPVDIDELLEMLFCGPLRKKKINDLNDKEIVEKAVDSAKAQEGVAAFMSKRDQKIRNYGINENEIYHIIRKHQIKWNHKKLLLYELTSENKLSSWNGNFSFTDEKWDKVDSKYVNRIFAELQTNKSFCMPETDLVHIFDHLMIFQGTESHNKDWVENFSDTDYPSFSQFQLNEKTHVFIRSCTNEQVRTSMILAKELKPNEFKYVAGAFHGNTFYTEISQKLHPGKYIICVYHDWILNKNGPYKIFISSSSHTSLARTPENYYPNFLEKLFKDHSKQMLSFNSLGDNFTAHKYYSTCLMADDTGFAYLFVRMRDYKKNLMILKIDEKVLYQERWEIMEPHAGRREVELLKNRNEEVIVILKTTKQYTHQKFHFPTTAFAIEDE